MSEHPVTPADHAAQAIVDLINASPRSPTKVEIEAVLAAHLAPTAAIPPWDQADLSSDLLTRIREACARVKEALRLWNDADDGKAPINPVIAEQAYDERLAELRELRAQIPDPPRSFADIVALAEIALQEDGHGEAFLALAIQLPMAVRQFAGIAGNQTTPLVGRIARAIDKRQAAACSASVHLTAREVAAGLHQLINSRASSPRQDEIEAIITKAMATPARTPAPSSEHLAYRELLTEIERYNEPGMSDDEEGDTALGRLHERGCKLETEIWAKPAKTLADVLLRAEIALHNENGVMDALDDPNAYYDDLANAQLIRAVLDVLGGPNAL